MVDDDPTTLLESIGVSLVDGDSDVRHARQIMLRSEDYNVRSYATCAALLADPRSRDYACIVVDIDMPEGNGVDLLRKMRASGWRGIGILLDGTALDEKLKHEAARNGDQVLDRTIGDRSLVAAIAASVDRNWSSWTAGG